jgi:hypothetical protein
MQNNSKKPNVTTQRLPEAQSSHLIFFGEKRTR